MKLLKRIFAEKRVVALPLALALVGNLAIYALVVYPLAARAAGASDRAAAANRGRAAAERELALARSLVAEKSRADEELATFYRQVLPADLSKARRLTYARLPELARKTNVRYEQGKSEIEPGTKGLPGRLKITMVLQGDYENIRRFIYQLETSPEFVIIDEVFLAQSDPGKPLTLTLQLSTYYRHGTNGT